MSEHIATLTPLDGSDPIPATATDVLACIANAILDDVQDELLSAEALLYTGLQAGLALAMQAPGVAQLLADHLPMFAISKGAIQDLIDPFAFGVDSVAADQGLTIP